MACDKGSDPRYSSEETADEQIDLTNDVLYAESDQSADGDFADVFVVHNVPSEDAKSITSTVSSRPNTINSTINSTDIEYYDFPDLESIDFDWDEWHHHGTDTDEHEWSDTGSETIIGTVYDTNDGRVHILRGPRLTNFSVSKSRPDGRQDFHEEA